MSPSLPSVKKTTMTTHRDIMNFLFRGKSLSAMLIGWAAVFLPFLLCLLIQHPRGGPLPYLETGLSVSLAGSLALFFLLALPPFYYLRLTGRDSLAAYTRIPLLWVALLAMLLGLAAMGVALSGGTSLIWWQSLLATMLVGFILLVFPALLWALCYWFLAIRPGGRTSGGMRAVTCFSILFVIWNLFCFLVAANWAVLLGG